MWTGKPERAAYEVISCAACFSFHRKLCFCEIKNRNDIDQKQKKRIKRLYMKKLTKEQKKTYIYQKKSGRLFE